ncbi:hypothetical protein SELMODRAFT_415937 [Selaginella moellendorffii]|uniref:AAA+ ATPase domain-containing protein n=1 Tax=Selaginella moellendorffii TaxID=88036 RepID=D8RYN1_SELML|nr:hypothetical protein SELMODRAFT_415937 [Selaginella moellendorffii]
MEEPWSFACGCSLKDLIPDYLPGSPHANQEELEQPGSLELPSEENPKLMARRRIAPFFYNRALELGRLETAGNGELLVLTGPPNSGKSALLSEFKERMQAERKGFPILIDMRAGKFNTAASFSRELKAKSAVPLISRVVSEGLKAAVGVEIPEEVEMETGQALKEAVQHVESASPDNMTILLERLEALFSTVKASFTGFTHGAAAAFPTLIIDEANRLYEWSASHEEQENLATLQEWLVMITKQKKLANVVLASSEDSFRIWMGNRVGRERFTVAVVGDLGDEESFEFFMRGLTSPWEYYCPSVKDYVFPQALWEEIHGYVGGRMLLLDRVAAKLSPHLACLMVKGADMKERSKEVEAEMKQTWNSFMVSLRSALYNEMLLGCGPHSLSAEWKRPGPTDAALAETKPLWTKEEYLQLLGMITARSGVVSEDEVLAAGVSEQALKSLIMHNFAHYRDIGEWGGTDLAWYKGGFPVVMAMSMPYFHAMKDVLARHGL